MDSHYKGADKLGRGIGYKYAHLYPKHYVNSSIFQTGLKADVSIYHQITGMKRQYRNTLDTYMKNNYRKQEKYG